MPSADIAVRKLVTQIAGMPHVSRVWLFGSRARGDARRDSDIDLAIEAPGAPRQEWLAISDLVDDADTLLAIDLVRMEEASPELKKQITREGELLYER